MRQMLGGGVGINWSLSRIQAINEANALGQVLIGLYHGYRQSMRQMLQGQVLIDLYHGYRQSMRQMLRGRY